MQEEVINSNNQTTDTAPLSSPSLDVIPNKPFDRKAHLAIAREKARIVNKARKGQATTRQKRALQLISENPTMPKGEALLQAGYSASVAKTPSKVFSQQIFQCLLDDIPDKSLTLKLEELATGEDGRTALGALDMIFKLKDRYPQNKLRIDMFKEELGNIME